MTFVTTRRSRQPRKTTTTVGGSFDGRILPQLLDTSQVQTLPVNYNIEDKGRIEKRAGRRELLEVSGGNPILFEDKFTDTFDIFAYGTTLAFWNKNDNTAHSIKTDFAAGITDGLRIGLEFFTCNGRFGDKIYKTTLPTMAYTGQSTNFTVGQVVTDSVTGGTATIIADSDSGATGTLTLDNIDGTFGANPISDPLGGDGTGSAITFTNTAEISASTGTVPKCERLFYFDLALVTGNTDSDTNEAHAAGQNDTTAWLVGVNAGDPYKVQFGRAGEVKAFGSLDNQGVENQGNQLFIGYQDGYVGTHNKTQEVGGVLTQTQVIDFFKLNAGVESTESTAQGVYYANEQGIFLHRVGQDRNSDDINLTRNFGKELDDFSFVGSKILFVPKFNRLLVLCRRDGSSQNNSLLIHNTETTFTKRPSWWRYQGWRLNSIHLDGDTVYGGSSLETKLYKLFSGTNDSGSPIATSYEQILNVNNFEFIGDMLAIYGAGSLTFGSDQNIAFDIIDEVGNTVTPTPNSVTFGADSVAPSLAGTGTAGMGFTGMGGTVFSKATSFTRKWYPLKIYNFSALLLKISGSDSFSHQFNWISVKTSQRRPQRKGLMTLNT